MHYQSIITLQSDDYAELEKVLYPDSDGVSLGWSDEKAGMAYLRQWDAGEATERCQTEYPFCAAGNDWHYETRYYVMCWSASYGVAGLWRKVGNRSCTMNHN